MELLTVVESCFITVKLELSLLLNASLHICPCTNFLGKSNIKKPDAQAGAPGLKCKGVKHHAQHAK